MKPQWHDIQSILTGKDTGQKRHKVHTPADKKACFYIFQKVLISLRHFVDWRVKSRGLWKTWGPITSDVKLTQHIKKKHVDGGL